MGAKKTGGFWFDKAAADRACGFFPRFLRHVKGKWAGQPFKLWPWQKDLVGTIFGWKRPDGTRRYRTVYVEIPRKNGKSAIAAGLGLYLLFSDGEPGAEVYSAAGDRDQAAIVFDGAKQMREASPALASRSEAYKRSIIIPGTNSFYKVLSADAPTKHGINAHAVIFDELHVQPTRDLWDTLTTSTGSRRQPLTLALTTAGFDKNTICGEQHDYAIKVKKGIIKDTSFLPVIYAAGKNDDWKDADTWRKANPNLGVSVNEDYLSTECEKAKNVTAYENTFKRLHLNIWTNQDERWMSIEKWDASGAEGGELDEAELKGKPCFAGLDLASTTDIAAFVMVFRMDDGYKVLPRFWIPEETLQDRTQQEVEMYSLWSKLGLLTVTEGDQIDYAVIRKQILDDAEKFDIREVAYDRWGATQMVQDLQGAGVTVVPIGQGFGSMSAPTKELIRLVLARQLHHGGHQVLRWMADNMSLRQDPAGNLKPDKNKSTKKIDGMVALIMGLARIMVSTDGGGKSIYDDRGVIVI